MSTRITGKALAVTAALVAALDWTRLIFTGRSERGMTTGTYLVAAGMILLSIGGVYAALSGRPVLLYVVFVLSFCPVGLYLLGTHLPLAAIGWANLILLLGGILMHLDAPKRDKAQI